MSTEPSHESDKTPTACRKASRAVAIGAVLATLEAALVARRRGFLFGMRTTVRCGDGHLFQTVWIPGASLTSLRFGPWRLARCPIGRHFTVITPVREADLGRDELESAREHYTKIP